MVRAGSPLANEVPRLPPFRDGKLQICLVLLGTFQGERSLA
jgi:hypothetical protein